MAHTCPDCGQTCYCGGDIDDCEYEDEEVIANCTCCVGREDEDGEDCDYDDYD